MLLSTYPSFFSWHREKWWVLGILWLVCLLNYADRQAISSLFPLLEQEFGFSKAELGLIGSALMWVYACASPVAGFFGDRFSRKRLILGGCLLWSLMTGFTGLSARLWQFVMARSLIGLGESVYFPSATSLLSDYHGEHTRSTALSLHQSAVYIGTIVGGGIAAWIGAQYGWRMAFYGFGLAGIFVALLIGKFLHEPVRGASEEISPDKIYEKPVGIAKKLHSLLKRPELLLLMTAFACANSVAAIFLIWAPSFLLEKFHLSLVAAGFSAVVAIQLASAMSAPLSGMLADRLSCRLKGGRILLQASGLLLGIFCVVAVARATTLPMLITAMIAFGLCKGAYDAGIFASVFDLVSPEERASVAGLMNMLGWGGGALGPLALGFMATYAHGTPMERMSRGIAWSSLAYLLAAGLLLWAFFIFRKGERKPLG